MKRSPARRRPAGHISLAPRLAALSLVALLGERPRDRESLSGEPRGRPAHLLPRARLAPPVRRSRSSASERAYNLKATDRGSRGPAPVPRPAAQLRRDDRAGPVRGRGGRGGSPRCSTPSSIHRRQSPNVRRGRRGADRAFRVTGEGLEPSTNGLTYLIGFRRPTGPIEHRLPTGR